MANDEQGGNDVAKWSGFEVSLPPPFMEPIITAVNDFLEQVIVLLDIALFVLDITKAFVVGLVSPLLAVLDYLIDLLEGLLGDLRKAGLYLRGDWSAIEGTDTQWKKNFLGGYPKYEGRAFQWLNDGSDPGRPDFSEKSLVIGMFFYVSVDYSSIEKAIKALMSLLGFLGRVLENRTNTPLPINVRVSYPTISSDGSSLFSSEPPSEVLIEWDYQRPPSTLNISPLPPVYCLVEVSTIKEGLFLGYTKRANSKTQPEQVESGLLRQSEDKGGAPYKTYSGLSLLHRGERFAPYFHNEANDPEAPALIAIRDLNDGDFISGAKWSEIDFNNERPTVGCAYLTKGVSMRLHKDSLPVALKEIKSDGTPVFEEEPRSEVWVRVTPITFAAGFDFEEATANMKVKGSLHYVRNAKPQLYWLGADNSPKSLRCFKGNMKTSVFGQTSEPAKAYFPTANIDKFVEMIRASVVIWILCRPDLDPDVPVQGYAPTGLKSWEDEIRKYLCPLMGHDFYYGSRDDNEFWKARIFTVAERVADDFLKRIVARDFDPMLDRMIEEHYDNTAGLGLQEGDKGQKLQIPSGFTLTDDPESAAELDEMEFLELMKGQNWFSQWTGIWKNLKSLDWEEVDEFVEDAFNAGSGAKYHKSVCPPEGSPGYEHAEWRNVPVFFCYSDQQAKRDNGSLYKMQRSDLVQQYSGVNFTTYMRIIPCRNAFSHEVLSSVRTILGVALEQDIPGEWISFRPLDQMLRPIDEFLESIVDFLKGVRKGLAAIVEQILKYIKMIEARVMEIQNLIRQIQQVIAKLKDFRLEGDLKYLLLSSTGTSGLSTDFMMAENKPEDGAGAYGLGGCIVMGGVPLLLLDLFGAILSPSDDE
tara:strand:+ start:390 stop:2990 length:2601 start_codon:yes stop_codon:yes gene_type:complete